MLGFSLKTNYSACVQIEGKLDWKKQGMRSAGNYEVIKIIQVTMAQIGVWGGGENGEVTGCGGG